MIRSHVKGEFLSDFQAIGRWKVERRLAAKGRRIGRIAPDTIVGITRTINEQCLSCRDMRNGTRAAGSALILMSELRKGEKTGEERRSVAKICKRTKEKGEFHSTTLSRKLNYICPKGQGRGENNSRKSPNTWKGPCIVRKRYMDIP